MAPTLFSKFIPNILPPAVESELSEYAAQDQKLQRELIQNGFMRQVLFSFVTKYVQFVARKAPGSSFGIVVTTVVGGSLTHFSCWDWGDIHFHRFRGQIRSQDIGLDQDHWYQVSSFSTG